MGSDTPGNIVYSFDAETSSFRLLTTTPGAMLCMELEVDFPGSKYTLLSYKIMRNATHFVHRIGKRAIASTLFLGIGRPI